MKKVSCAVITICSVWAVLFCANGFAQTAGGTILGRMTDSGGAVIPNAEVVITHDATGVTRAVSTNESGLYRAPDLTPGMYSIRATAKGFETAVIKQIELQVGSETTANLAMKLGSVDQTLVVQAGAPSIELSSSEMSQVVTTKAIVELPLNGRDWTQLAALQPGVATVRSQNTTDTNRAQRGNGVAMTISGGRPTENNYLLNGISINDYANSAPGSALGSNLGVDAIQEFSVQTSNFPAQYGKSSGGIINAITRSGTNNLHGTLYYFLRNSALDARNFFDVTPSPLPFRRNQFGGSAGGPIKKNKTFWFVDYEQLKESLSSSVTANTLTPLARSGAVASVQPFLTFFPAPNQPYSATATVGQYIFPSARTSNGEFATGKIDHRLSDKDSLNGTFLFDNGKFDAPDEMNNKLVGATSRRYDATLEESHIFSPSLFNSFRLGFTRTHATNNTVLAAINPSLSNLALGFIPGHQVGGISIAGVTTFSGGVGGPDSNNFHYNSYQVYDDVVWNRGIHTFKLGGVFERMQDNFTAGFTNNGSFSFSSVANFLTGVPTSLTALLPSSDLVRGIRQSLGGGYAQDDIRMRSNLTLNVGLRYEVVSVPSEVNGKIANLQTISSPAPTVGFLFKNPTWKDFSPRVGFAWDPFKDGKTSVRGGFGLYDVLPLAYAFTNRFPRTPPFFENGVANYNGNANFFPAGGYGTIVPGTFRAIYVQPNPSRPFKTQANINIQRELIANWVLSVGYVNSRGYNLVNGYDETNIAQPISTNPILFSPTAVKANTNFGRITATNYQGSSWYNGLQVNVKKNLSKGLLAQVAYTWAKSMDTGSNAFSTNEFANTVDNPLGIYDVNFNRALSDFDIRQNLVVNFLYSVPGLKEGNPVVKWIVNGWQAGSVFTVGSGLPFTVLLNNDRAFTQSSQTSNLLGQRPNYVSGCATTNPGSRFYVNTSCFTFPAQYTLGNLGRNTLTGPGLQNLDFSLFKNHEVPAISETFRVQFRAEIFNILNHTNFAEPDAPHFTIFDGSGKITSTAGQITSTLTASRQIQFGLKLIW
ncbi:MAG: TonB-dependent receptor plug [Bryobacterales bacterium]|nr:TonB-dependent receptor plug [Bryobacterales bacterium]